MSAPSGPGGPGTLQGPAEVTPGLHRWRRHPVVLHLAITALVGGSAVLVWLVPRSILAFMLFQASLLVIYLLPIDWRAKLAWAAKSLVVMTVPAPSSFRLPRTL